jgi:CO/xanthine dehydrogenase FAD-binding subunit
VKAAPFRYARPRTLDEACELLDDSGDRRVIAGGQTLVPMMAMRLARPEMLVDIGGLAALDGIEEEERAVVVRACTRQADAERSSVVRRRLPLLAKALRFVGHPQTRNRGTVGGSVANADPAAEIPLAALALGAEATARSRDGERTLAIEGFFVAPMVTSLLPAEILTALRFPVWAARGVGASFHEVSSRRSDFALVAVAAQVQVDAGGACERAAVALGGVGPTPVRSAAVPGLLAGRRFDEAAVHAAAAAIDGEIAPEDELHASADYRRRVSRALVARALRDAWTEALGGAPS